MGKLASQRTGAILVVKGAWAIKGKELESVVLSENGLMATRYLGVVGQTFDKKRRS
jgi:hypothetical protein